MAIEKTSCVVLSVMPYRESSVIATLLSRDHGRVSGIAKGIRRSRSAALVLEHGQIVELVIYLRPHRDLHTLGRIAVTNYFPAIRGDLGRLSLRDAALEIMLKSVVAADAHPELFDYAAAFLERLETSATKPLPLHLLWAFIAGWSHRLGFKMALAECVRCGSGRVAAEGGILSSGQGGLVCPACSGNTAASASSVPGAVVAFLLADERSGNGGLAAREFPPGERIRITRLFADYFRYHCDVRCELKSLPFLETIL